MRSILLVVISVSATVFFVVRSIQLFRAYGAMSKTERMEADYEAESGEKLSYKERLSRFLLKYGYRGDLTPAVILFAFGYLVCSLVLHAIGVSGWWNPVAAVPTALGASWITLSVIANKRRHAFSRQLQQLLSLLASQIESGVGARRALSIVVPNLGDPLRTEMYGVINAAANGKDLVDGLKELEFKYPSRAMQMTIAAFEIDRDQGGRIAPSLRRAAETLEREFELTSEAKAEISQSKMEFFGITAIIGFIAFTMFTGGGDEANKAYASLMGIVALGACTLNFLLGLWRAMRLFAKARGDL